MPTLCDGGISRLFAGRTSEKIDQVAHTIAGAGGSAEAIVTDTTSEGDVARLFDRAMAPRDSLNPVDLVAYNVGNNRRIDFREMTAQQFEDFWRVGCFGGFLVGREAARRLVPLGRGRSSSPVLRQACAASRAMLSSPRQKRG
jgi:NAD(P)-dependent dehydrogenase (short-subunit alcohol dehydrogenase family)